MTTKKPTKPAKKPTKPAKKSAKPTKVSSLIQEKASGPQPSPPKAPDFPVVNTKCRRGGDPVTEGQSCSCMRAHNLSSPGDHTVTLKCTKCGYVWTTAVGGSFRV